MRYLLDVQDGKADLLDCTTCDRPELHCQTCPVMTGDQPKISPVVSFYMGLHKRMTRYPGALPDPGGLLDQDERTMRILDVIGDEIDAARARKEQAAIARAEQARGRGLFGRLLGRR